MSQFPVVGFIISLVLTMGTVAMLLLLVSVLGYTIEECLLRWR